jgi:hypothetical protein
MRKLKPVLFHLLGVRCSVGLHVMQHFAKDVLVCVRPVEGLECPLT